MYYMYENVRYWYIYIYTDHIFTSKIIQNNPNAIALLRWCCVTLVLCLTACSWAKQHIQAVRRGSGPQRPVGCSHSVPWQKNDGCFWVSIMTNDGFIFLRPLPHQCQFMRIDQLTNWCFGPLWFLELYIAYYIIHITYIIINQISTPVIC